jgi:hypothetical protein
LGDAYLGLGGNVLEWQCLSLNPLIRGDNLVHLSQGTDATEIVLALLTSVEATVKVQLLLSAVVAARVAVVACHGACVLDERVLVTASHLCVGPVAGNIVANEVAIGVCLSWGIDVWV